MIVVQASRLHFSGQARRLHHKLMTHITFDPYIPLAMWAPLALATVALLTWYAVAGRRRLPAGRWWAVVTLMTVAAAVPLVVLLNPTWSESVPPPPGKPLLTILLDRSGSMGDNNSWIEEVQAIQNFVYDVHSAGIGVGGQYMPLPALCDPAGRVVGSAKDGWLNGCVSVERKDEGR